MSGDENHPDNRSEAFGPAPVLAGVMSRLMKTPAQIMRDPLAGGWSGLSAHAISSLTENVSPIDGRYRVHPVTTLIAQARLSFYPDVRLIRMIDGTWPKPGLSIYFLARGETLYRLDGLPGSIDRFNTKSELAIAAGNVLDYLRFHCFFVHGEHGPFLLAESPDQSFMPEIPDLQLRDLLEDILRPPIITDMSRDGDFTCTAIVLYAGGIFNAVFRISRDGKLEMTDDDPIFTELPMKVHAPLR